MGLMTILPGWYEDGELTTAIYSKVVVGRKSQQALKSSGWWEKIPVLDSLSWSTLFPEPQKLQGTSRNDIARD